MKQIAHQVAYAKSICEDIEFSPEDAGRTDVDFLTEALSVAIAAGATTLNIPDTVGYNLPHMYGSRLAYLIKHTEGAEKAIWSTHCHNDLGLATANTLAGVLGGARQAEVTINGIGERAGNTALEEVVMALHVHQNEMPVYCDIDTQQIMHSSNMVARHTGMQVQANKSIVGANAFSHESGIHQDGVLKHQETYEIMKPELVGLSGHDGMVLGKLSGRHAFRSRLEDLGYYLSKELLGEAFKKFKDLADSKKSINDGDLYAIVREVLKADAPEESFTLMHVSTMSSSHKSTPSTATVVIRTPDGKDITSAAVSNGPVNAICEAVDSIVGPNVRLEDYKIMAVSGGPDAVGEVSVVVSDKRDAKSKKYGGVGSDADVIIASAKAYVSAINAMSSAQRHSDEIEVEKREKGAGAAAV